MNNFDAVFSTTQTLLANIAGTAVDYYAYNKQTKVHTKIAGIVGIFGDKNVGGLDNEGVYVKIKQTTLAINASLLNSHEVTRGDYIMNGATRFDVVEINGQYTECPIVTNSAETSVMRIYITQSTKTTQ